MKKALLALLSLISLSTMSHLESSIAQFIKKSRPKELQSLLNKTAISKQDKESYLNLAQEVTEIRKYKLKSSFISPKPKKTPTAGASWKTGSILTLLAGSMIIKTLGSRNIKDFNAFACICTTLCLAGIMGVKGLILDSEEMINLRSNKDKFYDSLKVKELISSTSVN